MISELSKQNIINSKRILIDEILIDPELFIQFKSANYYIDEDSISIFNAWWQIAFHEIADYFLYELEKKNLPTDFSNECQMVIQYLTKHLPIQQAMFAIWASMKDSCSAIAEKNWELEFASKIIPENLKKKADRLIEGSLKYFAFYRPYSRPQSKLSKVFSEHVFELNEKYFIEIPNMKMIYEIQEQITKRRGF
jgi:hypothetical protein